MAADAMPVFTDYISLIKFGLGVLGVWPLDENAPKWRRTLRNVHVIVIYILLFALLIPQLLDLYVLRGDIQANTENLCTSLTTFTVLAKLSNLVANRRTFENTMREMEYNWSITMRSVTPKIDRDILLKSATSARSLTRRYCATMYITACMYFTLPLITTSEDSARPRQYPFCAWYYYDQTTNLVYFFFYASQVIIGWCCGTGNYTMDSLFLVMISHLCAQLQILQRELATLGVSGIKSNGMKDSNADIRRRMKKILDDHERHIRNAVQLKAVFDVASLQQLFVSSVIICVIGFKLIVIRVLGSHLRENLIPLSGIYEAMSRGREQLDNPIATRVAQHGHSGLSVSSYYAFARTCFSPRSPLCAEPSSILALLVLLGFVEIAFGVVRTIGHSRNYSLITSLGDSGFNLIMYLTYLHLVLVQIYLYCSAGNDLLVESEKIGRAAYECPWFELPSSVTKSLLLVTIRSKKPLRITAGNLYVMSMPNFTKILKTSVSYLSVLRAMYDDRRYRKF